MFPHSTAMTPKTQETIGSNVANRPVWVGPVEPSPLLALSKASSPNELAKTHHATIASCSVHETAPKARKLCGMRSILLKGYNVCIYIYICIMHILGKLMFSTKVAWEARTVCRKEGTALSNKSKTKVSCNTLRLVSTINNWPVSTRINWSLHRPLWALPMPIDYTLPKCDGSLNFWTREFWGALKLCWGQEPLSRFHLQPKGPNLHTFSPAIASLTSRVTAACPCQKAPKSCRRGLRRSPFHFVSI